MKEKEQILHSYSMAFGFVKWLTREDRTPYTGPSLAIVLYGSGDSGTFRAPCHSGTDILLYPALKRGFLNPARLLQDSPYPRSLLFSSGYVLGLTTFFAGLKEGRPCQYLLGKQRWGAIKPH